MRSAAPKARDGQSSGVSGELLATLDGGVAGRALHQRAEAFGDRPSNQAQLDIQIIRLFRLPLRKSSAARTGLADPAGRVCCDS
jgi:hypothetical protein